MYAYDYERRAGCDETRLDRRRRPLDPLRAGEGAGARGIAVRSFANAREVLPALDDDEPQVLVSDIRMPGDSGSSCWPRSRSAARTCR